MEEPVAGPWSLYTIQGNDSSLGVQRGLWFQGRGATLEGSRGFQPTVPRVIRMLRRVATLDVGVC
jgi:hypothetical protein